MDEEIKKQRSTIIQCYVIFIITLIGSFIPQTYIMIGSLVFFLALIIAVPFYQYFAPKGSLLENHMRYLNATIWWGSLFLMISVLIMGYWVYLQSDQSAFYQLFGKIQNGFMVSEADINKVFGDFFRANSRLLIQASIVCIAPPMIYIVYRISAALSRAIKYHRMGKTGT